MVHVQRLGTYVFAEFGNVADNAQVLPPYSAVIDLEFEFHKVFKVRVCKNVIFPFVAFMRVALQKCYVSITNLYKNIDMEASKCVFYAKNHRKHLHRRLRF